MNAIQQAQMAYAPTQSAVRTPRAIEAQLFSKVTAQLLKAKDAKTPYPSMVAALHTNRQMWTTLAADVADSDNGLPKELRAQLFYLAEFTEFHSQKVLRNEASLDALIEINTAMLRGLNQKDKVQ